MTATDRELSGVVRDWLAPGTTTLSERVFTAAMAEISTTSQRHGLRPLRRWWAWPRTTRFALIGTTTVAMVAMVGMGFLLSRPGPNVGPTVATPPATASPTAAPSADPSQSAAAQPTATPSRRGTVDAIDGLVITFDVPEGWSKTGETAFGRSIDRYAPHPPDGVEVSFWDVAAPWGGLAAGTTPADLVDAFARKSTYIQGTAVDASLAGYTGKTLRFSIPDGDCEQPGHCELWHSHVQPTRFGQPGERDTLWILDIDGIRLVIDAMSFAPTSDEDLAAQQRLVDSIRIERVAAAVPASPSPSSDQAPSEGSSGKWEAIDGLQITFDLPPGWSQPGGTGSTDRYPTPHVQGRNPGVAVNFYDEIVRVMPRPPTEPGVGPQDPGCRLPYGGNDDAGTTPADLAAKLQSDPHIAATKPVDVALDGFNGKRLELQIPDPVSDCYLSPGIPVWIGRPTGFAEAGQRDTVWILDVRGKRVLIEAVSFPGTSAEDLAAQQRLIESIRIERTAP